MTSRSQEAMFSLTPPPTDFDEFEKAALLTCSPSLSGYCYPSPAPSNRAHAPSISSDSLYIPREEMSFSEDQQQESHDMFFGDSEESPFYPISTIVDQDMAQYPTSSASYSDFNQPQWPQFPSYPQPTPLISYDQNSTSLFPPFETSMPHSYTSIMPPTPQEIAPVAFDFVSQPNVPSHQQHLPASPAFTYQRSHQRNLSTSMSRSPSPFIYQAGVSDTSSVLRSTLRSNSTSSNSSLHAYGIPSTESTSSGNPPSWRCAFPGCTSRATFTRGCDLRKHYNRHSKHLFCRVDGCPQSQAAAAAKTADGNLTGGFSSKKDRARHEAKHNPGIKCEWKGAEGEKCGRIFSRMDNMKDHVRRIHKKSEQPSSRS